VTIQDAENASASGDEILVTNGVYQTGGTADSRVNISNAKYVHSVNGPDMTIIKGLQPLGTNGPGSIRCATLGLGVTLAGFSLTSGASQTIGGGIRTFGIVSNCNIGQNIAVQGGGAYLFNGGTISDCRFHDNIAQTSGGGVFSAQFGLVTDCAFSNNLALTSGGGMMEGTCINSILAGTQARMGAGAYQVGLINCVITENSGLPGSPLSSGGGAYFSGMSNCLLTDNTAFYGGGGYFCFATNCTVVSNSASVGGGLYVAVAPGSGTAMVPTNTIVYYNNASSNGPNCYIGFSGTINRNCCTTDYAGASDITNAPLFVDPANGDFRLSLNSPCINAGRNSYVTNSTDLDGNPRLVGGTVDIGAYEFQNPQSVISYGWLQRYGLPTDGSVDYADPDGDGMTNWREWITNTDPTNSLSFLHMLSPNQTNNAGGVIIHWQSSGINYVMQRSSDIAGPFVTIAPNVFAALGTATYRDANATGPGPYFYRVGVQP